MTVNGKVFCKESWLAADTHKPSIDNFKCINIEGSNHVQLFLQEHAINLMERNLVRTKLFFDLNDNLIGYYSLFNDTIKINKKKREQLGVYLPQNVKEIPAIRLHYLGVDDDYRNKGYGDYLMASLITSCATVAKHSGCTLITLESTESVVDFYAKYDFRHVHSEGDLSIMAMNTKKLIDLI